jgi:hypothetical protein
MEVLAKTLGCSIGSMPFTYFGLPLGTTKPKVIVGVLHRQPTKGSTQGR